MNKIKKNESGFGIVEVILVLVIIVLIGFVAWLVYKDHHKTTTASPTTTATSNKSTTPTTQSPSNFFSCVSDKGTLATTGSASCTLKGTVYAFPSTFTTADILNYSEIPQAAQSVVTTLAQKNFSGFSSCIQNSQTPNNAQGQYPYANVSIVNVDFISVYINSCDNGYSEDYSLQGTQWTDLGVESPINATSGDVGLACSFDSKYNIGKSSVIVDNPSGNPSYLGYDTCVNSDGTTQAISGD
jgi:hypothetical protein